MHLLCCPLHAQVTDSGARNAFLFACCNPNARKTRSGSPSQQGAGPRRAGPCPSRRFSRVSPTCRIGALGESPSNISGSRKTNPNSNGLEVTPFVRHLPRSPRENCLDATSVPSRDSRRSSDTNHTDSRSHITKALTVCVFWKLQNAPGLQSQDLMVRVISRKVLPCAFFGADWVAVKELTLILR